jgi:hypothetical protein
MAAIAANNNPALDTRMIPPDSIFTFDAVG